MERTKPSNSKSEKDNKRKRFSKPEDPQDKKTPARRLRKRFAQTDADLARDSPDDEENDDETPKEEAGRAPVSAEVEIVPLSSTTILYGVNAETPNGNDNSSSEELGVATTGHSLSLPTFSEGAIEEANTLRMPDPNKVIEDDLFQGCYARIEDVDDMNDATTLFEEAKHLLSRAFAKFRAELRHCEAELKKVSGEEKAMRLLCSQKEKELKDLRTALVKAQKAAAKSRYDWEALGRGRSNSGCCHQWKKNMDQLVADKKVVTAQLASAEAQLQGVEAKVLAQARKIEGLEAELAKAWAETAQAKAEAVQAKAEVKKTKVAADKSIVIYSREPRSFKLC
ncbi:uncharacterized protein [Nicotiana sylvestris]|uniref:uncharacterized protein n=1 Tax=Nicotiana sylvestris TaxID=4096 RepID=UPI00388C41EF